MRNIRNWRISAAHLKGGIQLCSTAEDPSEDKNLLAEYADIATSLPKEFID